MTESSACAIADSDRGAAASTFAPRISPTATVRYASWGATGATESAASVTERIPTIGSTDFLPVEKWDYTAFEFEVHDECPLPAQLRRPRPRLATSAMRRERQFRARGGHSRQCGERAKSGHLWRRAVRRGLSKLARSSSI